MINPKELAAELAGYEFNFAAGVPCSILAPLLDAIGAHPDISYLGATNEGEAVALAAGAWLAGAKPVVLLQNSGLGNAFNPLVSLSQPYRIPLLLIMSWRGAMGCDDPPHHEFMGRITPAVMEQLGIRTVVVPPDSDRGGEWLCEASNALARRDAFAAIVVKDTLSSARAALRIPIRPTEKQARMEASLSAEKRPARVDVLRTIVDSVPSDAAIVCTTGKSSRELYAVADSSRCFYQMGSMGCVGAIGLGVALRTRQSVVVIDGDGALLMRLETMASIGVAAPPGLLHIVLDNEAHDSTGGQATISPKVDLARIAAACGYAGVFDCDNMPALKDMLRAALSSPGPRFIRMRIAPGSMKTLERISIHPQDLAARFRNYLTAR